MISTTRRLVVRTDAAPGVVDWREGVVTAYQAAREQEIDTVRRTLAERLLVLIGQTIRPESVYVLVKPLLQMLPNTATRAGRANLTIWRNRWTSLESSWARQNSRRNCCGRWPAVLRMSRTLNPGRHLLILGQPHWNACSS